MATLITKNSQTANAVPSAASLAVGELAVNTADGKLYTEHTGGVVKEIIPSTVVDNGITANKLASNAVTTAKIADANVTEAKIADGAVTTNKLSNSGVTAGTYTTATVTVDAKGRITSASSGSGGGVSSLNGQTGAITTTTLYAIGSFIIGRPADATNYFVNSTVAGSSLWATTAGGGRLTPAYGGGWNQASGAVFVNTGTWRCVSPSVIDGGDTQALSGLWVRMS